MIAATSDSDGTGSDPRMAWTKLWSIFKMLTGKRWR